MQDSDYPEAADYIRGYVKANQVNNYLELIKRQKNSVPFLSLPASTVTSLMCGLTLPVR